MDRPHPASLLARCIDAWIPDALLGESSELRRARIVVGICLLALPISVVVTLCVLLLDASMVRFYLLVVANIVLFLTPASVRCGVSPSAAAQFLMGSILLVLLASATVAGGIRSPSAVWLPVFPILAATLCGPRASLVWCGIATSCVLALWWASTSASLPPPVESALTPDSMILFAMVPLTGLLSFLGFHHERTQRTLLQWLEEERHRLAHLTLHDDLTGLANRSLLRNRLENALHRAGRRGSGFALVFIDLDEFKPVNDRYGHEAGDEVLRRVASRLCDRLRAEDTVARMGGDEFAVLLEGVSNRRAAREVVEGLLARLAEPIDLGSRQARIRASAGVAFYLPPSDTPESILRRADAAMYRAKAEGIGAAYAADPLPVVGGGATRLRGAG